MRRLLVLALSCALGIGQATTTATTRDAASTDAAAGIARAWQEHFAAARRHDVDGAAALYTDDVVYALTGKPEVRGKAAITAMERFGIAASSLGEVAHTTTALRADGAIAHELGTVRGEVTVGTAPARTVDFTYVAVWRRGADEVWRIARLAGHFPGEATTAANTANADIDLRPRFLEYGLPPRGQGHRPTCSIFTTTAVIEFAFARATGAGVRMSPEYCNWAANEATGRRDDGDFFHFALQGYERFGICRDELWPYAGSFAADAVPPPDALVDAGRRAATAGTMLRVRWLRPIDGTRGLSPAQFDDVLATLRAGWPIAVGAAHSRALVGYRTDAAAAGGGVFLTLDSGHGAFAEVTAAYVKEQICDAFTVEAIEQVGPNAATASR